MREALLGAAVLQAPLLLCLLTVLIAGVASALPFSPADPLLLAVAVAVPEPLVLPVIALATASHMGAKTLVYLGSRRVGHSLPARARPAVERARALLAGRRRARFLTVLASALAGVPPLYAVTLAYGTLRLPLRDFLIAGSIGRALRFTALILLPRLLGDAW